MSHLYDLFVPGVLAKMQEGERENRIRREPVIPSDSQKINENVTAWLPAGYVLVVLRPPVGWAKSYPYEAQGYVWLYVYAGKAQDHPDKKKAEHVVGWTAAGTSGAADPIQRFIDPVDPTSPAA